MSRARKRPRDAPTFIASFPLEVTATQRAEVTKRFDAAGKLYNACLGEALGRARRMRADPRWGQARALPKGPEKTARFRVLRAEYRFTEWDLMSFASGCRVAWLRKKVFAQEAQVLGRRAFEAVNGWVLGRRGKPRFKSRLRGLHSLECKDLASSMVIRETADGRVGLRWGVGMVLRFRLDARDPYQWWAAWHVAEGRMLRCRIVRTMINGKWAYRSQLVLAGHPLQRYATGHELVGVDVGPSTIAAVGDTGVFKETFCAELADHDRQIRRLKRRLDRQHRAGSPGCFDQQGRHRNGRCGWTRRSRRTQHVQIRLADTERQLAETRRSLHGNLANRILGQGTLIKAEKVSYRSFQRAFGRSIQRRAPGMFMQRLARKAERAGGKLIDVNPRATALSQMCICGWRERKPLSQRLHRCACGVVTDRDVFSAFLARHVTVDVDPHRLDVEPAAREWQARREGIRGRPTSTRFNRRVSPAVRLVGRPRGSEPVGRTGADHRRARPPADSGGAGTAA